jgi:hypothetical protein
MRDESVPLVVALSPIIDPIGRVLRGIRPALGGAHAPDLDG